MKDPYETLGVAKDRHGGRDPQARTASWPRSTTRTSTPATRPPRPPSRTCRAANDLLSDPDKRARFDRGEIDAAGDPQQERPSYRSYADAGYAGGQRYSGGR